jgi:ureidoacrylate peracid hydrolase
VSQPPKIILPEWLAPARTALLIIDIQVDFAAPDGAMARQGADMTSIFPAVEAAKALVAAARSRGVFCVFTRAVTAPHLETPVEREAKARRGDEGPGVCIEGTQGAEFAEPRPRAGEPVITKHRYSVFAGTGLAGLLRERGIDTLVLCGLTTECCIQSSAWDGFERDFHIVIAADAVAAYQPALHQAALAALEMNGAMLVRTAELAAAWK